MNNLEAQRFQQRHRCAVCDSEPQLFPDGKHGYEVRCINKEHQGFNRELTWTEHYKRGDHIPIEIAEQIEGKERRKMEQELGDEKTRALAPYQGVTSLTQEQATIILRTVWPDAPVVEVFKAALICKMYGLNPLMKHLYLVEFKMRDGGSKWAPILGIQATRLIASRIGRPSYIDGPRMMSKDEEMSIFGGHDDTVLRAITVIQDEGGNRASGYGSWRKADPVYGAEKGNSQQHMAHIRSERQALERLFPGEMPAGVEVGDMQYMPVLRNVDLATGEIMNTNVSGCSLVWSRVRELLKETKPAPALVTKWFKDHYDVQVAITDFDSGVIPERLTEAMLSRFVDSLLALKEQVKK